MLTICSSLRISSFLFLSKRVYPATYRRNLITAASTLLIMLLLRVQHSEPYINTDNRKVDRKYETCFDRKNCNVMKDGRPTENDLHPPNVREVRIREVLNSIRKTGRGNPTQPSRCYETAHLNAIDLDRDRTRNFEHRRQRNTDCATKADSLEIIVDSRLKMAAPFKHFGEGNISEIEFYYSPAKETNTTETPSKRTIANNDVTDTPCKCSEVFVPESISSSVYECPCSDQERVKLSTSDRNKEIVDNNSYALNSDYQSTACSCPTLSVWTPQQLQLLREQSDFVGGAADCYCTLASQFPNKLHFQLQSLGSSDENLKPIVQPLGQQLEEQSNGTDCNCPPCQDQSYGSVERIGSDGCICVPCINMSPHKTQEKRDPSQRIHPSPPISHLMLLTFDGQIKELRLGKLFIKLKT
ncbi:hypothetical protein ANN_05304 [Periplaneta americana]|uniref:Uncharacterized protein n=1 Tax=Periplaneta americana TaxID=6978 RepID=A0ABQ8TCS5_PERAM|nr:hypothetical protein ANN_05304 [Periplaneta americana]